MVQLQLTAEQRDKNILVFQETIQKYEIFNDSLLEFLGEEIYTAPASSQLDYHNCFIGGLLDHIIRITRYASYLNKILPDDMKQEMTSIVKVSFLSQIGKCYFYKPNSNAWFVKERGVVYEYTNEIAPMKISERSLFFINQHGIKLTDFEYQSITSLSAREDDLQYKNYSDTLSIILKTAINLAMNEEKDRWKKIQN